MAVEDQYYDPADLDTSVDSLGHDHQDVEEYADLAVELREAISGEVRFDEYAQVLYATDGSVYQARPAGVVCPRDTADVRTALEIATAHEVPIMPRGTGSSLAGQSVGPGCVVLDMTRYMDSLLDIDIDNEQATIQPGLVQDHLDNALAEYGYKFAPDPASSNRSTIGGGIGNNSTGAHSVRYGITDAYTDELRVVLSDGSLIHTREVVLDSPEYEEIVSGGGLEARIYRETRRVVEENEAEIAEKYPDLKRSVSGYNLQKVIYENEEGKKVINLSKLFVGAEGTLGVVVEATLSLVTRPDETALALYFFDDLIETLSAVPEALEYDVGAVELMDDEVFRLAANSEGFAQYVEPVPEEAKAALMLEFDSELVSDFEGAIAETNEHFVEEGNAFGVLEAYTEEDQADIWNLRKAAIPLLMSLEGDPKPYPFIEDATVPPEELAEYVEKFEQVLEDHDTSAAYFAHAGSGTLHIRPILNLKDGEGIESLHSITEDITDLVLEHYGAFSGEHGDGMARTEFNPKMYGPELWTAFKDLKTAFDPEWLMHPGNVVYRNDAKDVGPDNDRGVGADNRSNLRYGATYQSVEPQTELAYDDAENFSHLVELCNGCGTCRQTDSNVMCPTYRASKEEIQTTRGRANMLRAGISGEIDSEEMYSDRFQEEVLDLCIGCKGCKSDCPTGVDMAKLKTEVKHQYHQREGLTIPERLFANIETVSRLGSAFAPLSNVAPKIPGSRRVMEEVLGIAAERELPQFSSQSFEDWFEARGGPRVPEGEATDKVLLFPDVYTNYSYPRPGRAAVHVLEAAGIHVEVPEEVGPSGRPAFSKGCLDLVEQQARHNVDVLEPRVEEGWSVVFIEPSDAVMFQDEYVDVLSGPGAGRVAANAYGIMEFLDAHRVDETLEFSNTTDSLSYHGHCNQKATNKDHHAVGVLRRAGYGVDPLDSTCCGMAGSFGYLAEHYELSQAIGRILFRQAEQSEGDRVTAPGASCRSQLGDRSGYEMPPHPIEMLAEVTAGRVPDTPTVGSSPEADGKTGGSGSIANAVAGLLTGW